MRKTQDDKLDLKTEAVLESTIQFNNPLSKNLIEPKSIFLTGATGFLGAYLLDELLHKTTANIYCLVRCNHFDEGKQRLQNHLQFYSLWNEKFSSRIIPIVGDLSKPLFGLSEQQFSDLAHHIDVIYHNGAQVNAARPYEALKTTNVLGTQEILRLASLIQTKAVHFISSIAVFFSQAHHQADIKETDDPDGNTLKGGYRQSKWVAEQLIIAAQERGLPASIYRAGRIWGHSQTGITGNLDDLLCGLIKGCIQMGSFPTSDIVINVAPVDYISQAIIHLSRQSFGKVFHLLNPHSIAWKQFFELIRALGYFLEEISNDEWLAELKRRASQKPKDKLYSMLLLMMRLSAFFSDNKPQFRADHTHERLTGTSIVCSPVDAKLLSTYFSYFHKSGYIESRYLSKG
jgi:thioester reductase-like protein